jgi:hypothetical protein
MKRVIPGLKNNQKIRVIVDGVGIYMTVRDAATKFATATHGLAVRMALESLVKYNTGNPVKATGQCGSWAGRQVQVDLLRD